MTVILKKYQDVFPYILEARKCADLHRNELGFLTPSAYEDQALQGRLWICVDAENKGYLGHLLFGGKYPTLKVFQLLVHPEHRKGMIPFRLLAELESFGTENSYLNITARVAEDLPANRLWDFFGYKLIRQVRGGRSRGRKINLRSKELETTSLLSIIESNLRHDCYSVNFCHTSVYSSNLYLVDVNVVLDITRKRVHRKEASSIIRAGLNNKIRVAITNEFINELKRTGIERQSDPLLELACALPIVGTDDHSALKALAEDLRRIIFPFRSLDRKACANDESDLLHVATCILVKANGFITREKAILQAKSQLQEKYGLDVISVCDLKEPLDDKFSYRSDKISLGADSLEFAEPTDSDMANVRQYLSKFRLNEQELDIACNKGTTGAIRQRIKVLCNGEIFGFASWDTSNLLADEIAAFLILEEDYPLAEKAIDHIIELIIRQKADGKRIVLHYLSGQQKTRETALLRGFRSSIGQHANSVLNVMIKASFYGVITEENWELFVAKFAKLTDVALPKVMPNCISMDEKCLKAFDGVNRKDFWLSYFDLETLASPVFIMPKERQGILLPIRPAYAIDLGVVTPSQGSLLEKKEAYLRVEKAYFRKNRCCGIYQRGSVLLFYISKKGEYSQSVAGCARITYTGPCAIEEIDARFHRQGVLPLSELEKLCDRKSRIHCITFDNLCAFKSPISLSTLKYNQNISARNLITGEAQDYKKTVSLLKMGML